VEIISEALLNCLPFSSEPFALWADSTDLFQFLDMLYDFPSTVLTADGESSTSSSRWMAKELYKGRRESFLIWLQEFATTAMESPPMPGAANQTIVVPDFSNDPRFGRAAKYFIAWESLIQRVLEDSVFFSIAHVLESEDDLKCSFHLSAQLYYKQALQVLRSFLEDLVLPIHFCENPQEYTDWKASNYRTPPMRGQNGMLMRLVAQQILPHQLATEVSDLYGDLNSFVHGSEKRLINRGSYIRTWMGHVFKDDDFGEWCKYLSRSVDVGMRLVKINLHQWERFSSQRRVVCPICHNDKGFDIEKFSFGGQLFTKYRCRECGDEITLSAAWRQTYRVTYGDEEWYVT